MRDGGGVEGWNSHPEGVMCIPVNVWGRCHVVGSGIHEGVTVGGNLWVLTVGNHYTPLVVEGCVFEHIALEGEDPVHCATPEGFPAEF